MRTSESSNEPPQPRRLLKKRNMPESYPQAPASRRVLPAVAGELVLAGFFLLEPRLRRSDEARSLQPRAEDEGTTRLLALATAAAGTGTPVVALLVRTGRVTPRTGLVGVAAMVAGVALRVWSARTLGAAYTRTLQTSAEQPLLDSGPYARVRHPGYAGVLAMWLGYGLSWRSVPAVGWSVGTTLPAYLRRVTVEEALLAQRFPAAYPAYRCRTARLVPGVY